MDINQIITLKNAKTIDKTTAISLCLQLQSIPNNFSQTNLQAVIDLGYSIADALAVIGSLYQGLKIEVQIQPFSVTWQDQSLFVDYSPEEVLRLKSLGMVKDKGYLFFCLMAENPVNSIVQNVNLTRLTEFYKMDVPLFLDELSGMLRNKIIESDLVEISIKWLEEIPLEKIAMPTTTQKITAIATDIAVIATDITAINNKVTALETMPLPPTSPTSQVINQITEKLAVIEEKFNSQFKPIAEVRIHGIMEKEPWGYNFTEVIVNENTWEIEFPLAINPSIIHLNCTNAAERLGFVFLSNTKIQIYSLPGNNEVGDIYLTIFPLVNS